MRNLITILLGALLMSTLSCSKAGEANLAQHDGAGKGGSLARFTIAANHLYLVTNYELKVFTLRDPANPLPVGSILLQGPGVAETIFPYQDKLFIGSTNGMYIYSLTDPSTPTLLGQAAHVRACDPVVANDSISFVTLRGGACGPATDGLYIYNIKDIKQPLLIKTLEMRYPVGLGLNGSTLYVCRLTEGLTSIDVSKPATPRIIETVTGEEFLDVISYGNVLICYVKDGIALYDISDPNKMVELSKVLN